MKKKGWFMENFELPKKNGVLCTIDGEILHLFIKNMLIGDFSAPSLIT